MRICFINLARAADRRRDMERQLGALGLSFERIDAVDGKLLTAQDRVLVDDRRRRRITPYPLSNNEIGCWLSHRRAIEMVADSDQMAVVMEDDAELTVDFAKILDAIEQDPPDFDFIFLHRKFKKGEKFLPCEQLAPGIRLGRVGPAHMGAIGYIVSPEGAQKFLDYAPRFVHAVDKEIHRYWANGLNIFGLEKPVILHVDGGHSFIEETREQERSALRPRYPDADKPIWRMMRRATRLMDSVRKRIAWAKYVRAEKEKHENR